MLKIASEDDFWFHTILRKSDFEPDSVPFDFAQTHINLLFCHSITEYSAFLEYCQPFLSIFDFKRLENISTVPAIGSSFLIGTNEDREISRSGIPHLGVLQGNMLTAMQKEFFTSFDGGQESEGHGIDHLVSPLIHPIIEYKIFLK